VSACIEKAQVCLDNFQVLIGELLVNFISFFLAHVAITDKFSFRLGDRKTVKIVINETRA
jgi:hypothetical protein